MFVPLIFQRSLHQYHATAIRRGIVPHAAAGLFVVVIIVSLLILIFPIHRPGDDGFVPIWLEGEIR
jgi:hypothetical protein